MDYTAHAKNRKELCSPDLQKAKEDRSGVVMQSPHEHEVYELKINVHKTFAPERN